MSLPRLAVIVLIAAGIFHAQPQAAPAGGPEFEVASVKPFPGGGRGGRPSLDAEQFSWPGATLRQLIVWAYKVDSDQVSGPDWLDSEMYSVVAKIPAGSAQDAYVPMLRNLLAERFRMTVHHETKVLDGYDLVVAKGGPKLKESVQTQSGGRGSYGPNGADRTFNKITMQFFANQLGMRASDFREGPSMGPGPTGRVRIVDKTGLTGEYDIELRYSLLGTDTPGDDIFSALESQLGLNLKPTKITVDMVIVDHAERTPMEN